jgi:hypothetical protein
MLTLSVSTTHKKRRRFSMSSDTDTQLLARITALEDRFEIADRMARYGNAADSGSADDAANLWTEDGVYDAGMMSMTSSSEVAEMLLKDHHQGFMANGVAHLTSPPIVVVDGDEAVSTCYSIVILRDQPTDGFRVWRVSANRWDWVRTSSGWRIASRVNRSLDGTEEARALLRTSLREGSLGA